MHPYIQIVMRVLLVLVIAVLVVSGVASVLNWLAQIVSMEETAHQWLAWAIACAATASALFVLTRAHTHNVKANRDALEEGRKAHEQIAAMIGQIGAPDGEDVLDAIDAIAEAKSMASELMEHPDVADHPGLYPELHQLCDQLDMARTFLGDTDNAEDDRNEAVAAAVHSLHDDAGEQLAEPTTRYNPQWSPEEMHAARQAQEHAANLERSQMLHKIHAAPTITPPARDPNS